MSQSAILANLIGELDRINRFEPGFPQGEIPGFTTTKTGRTVLISNLARENIRALASEIYRERSADQTKIEIVQFEDITKITIAEMYAEAADLSNDDGPILIILTELKSRCELEIDERGSFYTHHIPAWTQRMEAGAPIVLGPVRFLDREAWIDEIEFHPYVEENFLYGSEFSQSWKKELRSAIAGDKIGGSPSILAGAIFNVLKTCPCVLTVTIAGFEKEFSAKLARMVCKTALDATSLCFQSTKSFQQQIVHDERVVPFSTTTLLETDGFLHAVGFTMRRVPELSAKQSLDIWDRMQPFHVPIAAVLTAMVDPSSHSHPQLAGRWATALDWLAEGCREPSDSVALAKVATSLDVLACGGKSEGILAMVSHLMGRSVDDQVIKSGAPMTLRKLIEKIYNFGRSRILHGNHYDRLRPFSTERMQATQIAISVLLEAVLRLHTYSGPDDEKAFRAMRPAPTPIP